MRLRRSFHGFFLLRPRFWIGVGVTAFWLWMLSLLWMREAGGGGRGLRRMGVSPEVLLVSWSEVDEWMWVEQGGERLGATRTHIQMRSLPLNETSTSKLPGYTLDNRWRMAFQMFGMKIPFDIALHGRMNGSFELETLQARLEQGAKPISMDAFVEGRSLYYRVRIGNPETKQASTGPDPVISAIIPTSPSATTSLFQGKDMAELFADRDICGRAPLKEAVVLADMITPIVTHTDNLREGESWQTHVADPIGGLFEDTVTVTVEGRETIKIGGEDFETWRLHERSSRLNAQLWCDDSGYLFRRRLENGMTWTRARLSDVIAADPAFKQEPIFSPIDREWIKNHLDPQLDGKPLEGFLPSLPGL